MWDQFIIFHIHYSLFLWLQYVDVKHAITQWSLIKDASSYQKLMLLMKDDWFCVISTHKTHEFWWFSPRYRVPSQYLCKPRGYFNGTTKLLSSEGTLKIIILLCNITYYEWIVSSGMWNKHDRVDIFLLKNSKLKTYFFPGSFFLNGEWPMIQPDDIDRLVTSSDVDDVDWISWSYIVTKNIGPILGVH